MGNAPCLVLLHETNGSRAHDFWDCCASRILDNAREEGHFEMGFVGGASAIKSYFKVTFRSVRDICCLLAYLLGHGVNIFYYYVAPTIDCDGYVVSSLKTFPFEW